SPSPSARGAPNAMGHRSHAAPDRRPPDQKCSANFLAKPLIRLLWGVDSAQVGLGIADPARVWNPLRSSFRHQQAAARSLLRWRPTLNGGADVSPLPAFETVIRKAGFSIVVS